MSSPVKPSLFRNQWLGQGIRIGLGVFAIYFFIHTGALKPHLLARAITRHPWWYAAAFCLYGPILEGLSFLRWFWLLREAKVEVSAGFVLKLHMIGLFFNGVLPGGNGGDIIKGFYLLRGRDKAEGAAALGTIVIDRFAGLLGLLWLGAVTNILNHHLWEVSRMLSTQIVTFLGVSLASAIFVSIYLSPWKPAWLHRAALEPGAHPRGSFLKGFLASLVALRDAPLVFWSVIGISMLVHLCLVGVYALCAQALEISLPFKLHAFIVPTLTLLNGIPISPAGLGVGEAGGALLYHAVGVAHGGIEIPALVHTIVFLIAFLCAPVYFLWGSAQKKIE